MKIKKHPSAVGVVKVDRQATSENKGRHFSVRNGAVLEVDGLTLTVGDADVRFYFFEFFLLLSQQKKYAEGLWHVGAADFARVSFFLLLPRIPWTH